MSDKKRIRNGPIRKWQPQEEQALIHFLKNNINEFEKPTSQVYYKKFIDEYNMKDIVWKLVRSKVRNMRICYSKARQWKDDQPENYMVPGENIEDVLHRMCSYYDDFEELFGSNCSSSDIRHSFDYSTCSSSDIVKEEMLSDTSDDIILESEMPGFTNGDSNDVSVQIQNHFQTPGDAQKPIKYANEEHSKKPNKTISDPLRLLKEEELKLLRERLDFDKERLRQEMEIKQKEIDSNERLKILELEMRERIAMNELKMKERVALKVLDTKN
ncbi:uncharacterized protein LOC142241367 [Haematobia irritans]|uniref:uncharacterized protein LOC142241367 n=1 Tax=Haematobia irritans TaxID=7368 RepID=UPI003F4F7E25